MERPARRGRRATVQYGLPALGAFVGNLAGKATGLGAKGRVASALLGAGVTNTIADRAVRRLDKRDLRRAGFKPHSSSMILGSRYAPEGSYIKFNSGDVYRYGDVTAEELRALARADSVGSHFNTHLKKRKYEKLGKL